MDGQSISLEILFIQLTEERSVLRELPVYKVFMIRTEFELLSKGLEKGERVVGSRSPGMKLSTWLQNL
jgi:hypothetical protein